MSVNQCAWKWIS